MQMEEKISLALENYFFSRHRELLTLRFELPRDRKNKKKVGIFKANLHKNYKSVRFERDENASLASNLNGNSHEMDFLFKSHIWSEETNSDQVDE